MENDAQSHASAADAEDKSLDSAQQGSPSEDTQAGTDSSSNELKARLEDLEKRRAGESRKINELTEQNKALQEQLNQVQQSAPEVQEPSIPESLQGKIDPEQYETLKPLIQEELKRNIPEILQSDDTVQRMAEKAAKEDEASLSQFKDRFPDAYQGDDLLNDIDPRVEQTFKTLLQVDKSTPAGELAELAYAKTYPDKYREKVQDSSFRSADSFRDQQIVGGGAEMKPERERGPSLDPDEKRFLERYGVDPNKYAG